ncbi:hypothetical protein FA13DRAFT_1716648 [Coprinellus micaceus]|uniref:Uncharacterized protein n=1 Tax=Coprinellus micaceus TaxID=71717 RepID=A0A4Y7SIP8_COPMI|nr:hypothetical protein FA13DRAFT_1716648 [Coprinellus micaceus]
MRARQNGAVDALCLTHFTACQTVRYSTSYCCCSASDTAAAVTLRVLRRYPRMRARQNGAVDALCLTHFTACQTVRYSTGYCCCSASHSASHTVSAVTLRVLRRYPRMWARQDGVVDVLCLAHFTARQTVLYSSRYSLHRAICPAQGVPSSQVPPPTVPNPEPWAAEVQKPQNPGAKRPRTPEPWSQKPRVPEPQHKIDRTPGPWNVPITLRDTKHYFLDIFSIIGANYVFKDLSGTEMKLSPATGGKHEVVSTHMDGGPLVTLSFDF